MKTYTEEFKKTIVEIYETGNKTKSELAREYGTSECNVRAWRRHKSAGAENLILKRYRIAFLCFIS